MKTTIYKKIFVGTSLATGVALAVLGGCGGGGGGGSTESEVVSSTLDVTSVETLAGRAVLEADCVGVSGIASLSPTADVAVQSSPIEAEPVLWANRVSDYTGLINGLISGTFAKTGEHDNGTDTLTYQFSNYTNPVGGLVFAANGSARVIYHGVPGLFAPVQTKKTVDTNGPVTITKSANSGARSSLAAKDSGSYEISVSGLSQVYAALTNPDDLLISSAVVKNLQTGEQHLVRNLRGKGTFSSTQAALTGLSYSYTSPDVGTLEVTSDSLVIELDGMKIPKSITGTLAMTATDGTRAETVIEANGTIKIYQVDDTGTTLTSEVNCASLVH
ncbi:MAG: hypothetical protein H8E21_06545 [Gammaproteobacteria bacterium]|nr:hypothetical protein [Gammaproteobacteria bacterium]